MKIKNIQGRILLFFYDLKSFGFIIAITSMIWPLIAKMPPYLVNGIMLRKHKYVQKHFIHRYAYVIEEFRRKKNISEFCEKAPIWVCWLQGEDNLPEIPTACLKKIRKHSNGHPVVFLTLNNYSDYITLPTYIINKYNSGQINHANFTDIIRTVLIAEIGGCWIDSTILVTQDLNENTFKYPFYSIKFSKSGYYISENLWSNYFLIGQKQSIVYEFVKEMFYEYFKNEDRFIDYFMMDYIIRIGYENVSEIKRLIDEVPFNNIMTHELAPRVFDKYDENKLGNTYLFKLSWKIKIKATKGSYWEILTKL